MANMLIKYVNLVHAHGLWSKEAEDFKAEHRRDPVFSRRVKVLDELFLNRDELPRTPHVVSNAAEARSEMESTSPPALRTNVAVEQENAVGN